jgi:hypothetical protein
MSTNLTRYITSDDMNAQADPDPGRGVRATLAPQAEAASGRSGRRPKRPEADHQAHVTTTALPSTVTF